MPNSPRENTNTKSAVLISKFDVNDADLTILNEFSDVKPHFSQPECIGLMTTDDLHELIAPHAQKLRMKPNSFVVADSEFFPESYEFKSEHYETSSVVVDVPEELPDAIAKEYENLQILDELSYVRNAEAFTCSMCFELIAPSKGIVLRECIHEFCTKCLLKYICTVDNINVKCPFKSDAYDCNEFLQQRDLRAILPATKFNALLEKSFRVRKAYLIHDFR